MKPKKKIGLKKSVGESSDNTWNKQKRVKAVPLWVLKAILNHGTGFENGKKRVYEFVKDCDSNKEIASHLKSEYGLGGFGYKPDDNTKNVLYGLNTFHSKIEVEYIDDGVYYICSEIKWTDLAPVIKTMVISGEYQYKDKKKALTKKKLPTKKLLPKKKGLTKKPGLKKKGLKKTSKKKTAEELYGESSLVIVPEENEDGYTGKWHNVVEGSEEVLFPIQPEKKKVDVIDNVADLKVLCDYMMTIPAFAYDTETNTLDVLADNPDFRCADITISWGENNNYDIVLGHLREEDLCRNIYLDEAVKLLKPVFEREDVLIIGANIKFDLHVFRRLGIHVRTKKLFDTNLASWICDENTKNGLKENTGYKMGVAQTHFKETTNTIPSEVKKQFGYKANSKVSDFGLVLVDEGKDYCTNDSFYTWCLYLGFRDLIIHEGMDKIYYNRMIPFMLVLLEMEEKGVTVDKCKLKQMQTEMEEDLNQLTYDIYELAGVEFNIGSSQQKAELLFGWEKPDTPVNSKKVNKQLATLIQKFKDNEIEEEDFLSRLDKAGYYLDEKKKVWKRANRNYEVLEHSFNFSVLGQTDSGAPSTDKVSLAQLSKMDFKNRRKREGVELAKKLLEYSKLDKLKGTFADGILDKIALYSDGKAHTNYNQIGTDSGRISSSNPNLQQLPNADEKDKYQIRDVFIGSEYYKALHTGNVYDTYEELCEGEDEKVLKDFGYVKKRKHLIAIDYHNLEMVCLCYFSHDKNLTEMFANDDDAHGSTAVNMFGLPCTPVECKKQYPHLRQAAKTINFMLMYGGGASTLYENLKYNPWDSLDLGSKEYLEEYDCHDGVEVAQKFIDKYFESYSGVTKFIKNQHRFAHSKGYVWTILGRKRRLPDINSSNRALSSKAERLSVNASIQGTAGDITSSAQVRIDKEQMLKDRLCYMLMQVHDEVVFECPEEYLDECIEVIKHDMEHPFGESEKSQVPFLRADPGTGMSYQEAK